MPAAVRRLREPLSYRAKLLSLAEAWVNLATEAEQYEALRLNEWERKMPHYP